MTVILPEYSSEMMINLMNVLMNGEFVVVDKEEVAEVENLAESLRISLNLGPNSSHDNDSISSDASHNRKIRVKNMEDMMQTSSERDPGSFKEDCSVVSKRPMRSTNRENFEESSWPRKELEQAVSLGHDDADFNGNVSKDHVQMSDVGNPSARAQQLQEDSSSHNPAKSSINDIDIHFDEDLSCEDNGVMSEDEAMMIEEAFKEYESLPEDEVDVNESENEDESDANEDEDHELNQKEDPRPDQPDHAGAKDEDLYRYDDGWWTALSNVETAPEAHTSFGSQSKTPPPSCSIIRFKRRSMIEKYTFDRVTKKYSCRICHKEFSKSSGVWRHIKTAHEGLRYPCVFCGKTFSQRGNMRRHIQLAH